MTLLSARHSLKKDLERVKRLSSKIEGRLYESDESKIECLSQEQMRDLNAILKMADYILTKYEDKRDFYDILREFVTMIRKSASSVDEIDSDIEEMILSAEESISLIRDAQARVADRADLGRPRNGHRGGPDQV